jgi:hypothetical protein
MVELSALRRELDLNRPIDYCGVTDDHRVRGYLVGWNCKLVFVQFSSDQWQGYPRHTPIVTTAIFPEHLIFAKRS